MTWVRIDDGFAQHPKVASVGPLGLALQVAGLCYCNRNLTDGFIPWAVAHSLLAWSFADPEVSQNGKRRLFKVAVTSGMQGDDVESEFVIGMLVVAGIWDEVDGGFQVHDYADYQPTRADVEAMKAQKQAAGKAGGQARAKALAKAGAQAKSKPIPIPNPIPSSKSEPATAKAAAVESDAEFISSLRSRFPSLDFEYELQKWRDHIAVKPPKANFKNSLRNWLENAVKFNGNGIANSAAPADLSFFEQRYAKAKEATA